MEKNERMQVAMELLAKLNEAEQSIKSEEEWMTLDEVRLSLGI